MNIDKLTDQQIIDIVMSGDNMSFKDSLNITLALGNKKEKNKAFKLTRQALKENKTLHCVYVDGESCDEEDSMEDYLEMWIE